MFEIGWTEMLVIAIVMIVVVGPKDLPKMLRTIGKTVAKLRGMAGDFQKQFNDALKEAELDGVKESLDEIRGLNPMSDIKKQLNPFEKAAADVRAGLDKALKPSTAAVPADPAIHVTEPLKTGATAMPGVAAPEAVASPPPDLTSTAAVPVSGPVAGPTPVSTNPTPAAPARKARATKAAPVSAPAALDPPAPAAKTTAVAASAPAELQKPAPRKSAGAKAESPKTVASKATAPGAAAFAAAAASAKPLPAGASADKTVAAKASAAKTPRAEPAKAAATLAKATDVKAKSSASNGANRSGRAK